MASPGVQGAPSTPPRAPTGRSCYLYVTGTPELSCREERRGGEREEEESKLAGEVRGVFKYNQ